MVMSSAGRRRSKWKCTSESPCQTIPHHEYTRLSGLARLHTLRGGHKYYLGSDRIRQFLKGKAIGSAADARWRSATRPESEVQDRHRPTCSLERGTGTRRIHLRGNRP